MNATKQAIWLFFTLVVLACSGWYFASSQVNIAKLDKKTLAEEADIVIKNLTVSRFDEAGNLINYLRTPQLQHFPQNETHFLKSPWIMVKQANQPAWEISAEQAKAIHKGEKIIFMHHVIVHQAKSENAEESTIKTERLVYFPKEKLATTNLAVRFEQPGTVIHSQGMRAHLDDKRIQLSNARATYEPKRG